MQLCELKNLNYEIIPTICYKSDGNTVTVKRKKMAHLFDALYIGEPKQDDYGYTLYQIFIRFPEIDGLSLTIVSCLYGYNTIEELHHLSDRLHLHSLSDWMDEIERQCGENQYFRNSEILFISHASNDLAEKMKRSKLAYIEERDRKANEEAQRLHAENQSYVNKRNAEEQQKISDAINQIRVGGKIGNDEIYFFEMTGTGYTWKIVRLIPYLCQRYGVTVPIRTLGWMNKTLTAVQFRNGQCSEYYIHGGGRSETAFTVLNALAYAVIAEEQT